MAFLIEVSHCLTVSPFELFLITSLIPVTFVPITGNPHDMASSKDLGFPSYFEVIIYILLFDIY